MQGKVVEILSTVGGRTEAFEVLNDGMLAAGSRSTKEAKRATHLKFAQAAGVELFPLRPETFGPILGAMRIVGYTSTDAYIPEARGQHVRPRGMAVHQPASMSWN